MTSARLAAAALVSAVTDDGRTLDDALAATRSYDVLEGRDRAFARAIASATLRRLGTIDSIVSRFVARPLPESARVARALLRTAAAQLLALRTPAHAVVSETVAIANAGRSARGFAGLMNAVLRKVATEGPALFEAAAPGADLPAWLWTRWRAAYGAKAEAIALALREEAPVDLTVRDGEARDWAARLGGALSPTGGVRLEPGARISELDGYSDGAWWVQDSAAALPARMLGDVRGQRVLDMCAAPGGKTLQLAAVGATVTALDASEARLARVRDNLERTRLQAEIVCADARTWRSPEPFDAVLLDAPCTATGTLRRHPDAAWLRRPTDVSQLAALQSELLRAARDLVRPGGTIVYAVCSLEPEEGEGAIDAARALDLTIDSIRADAPEAAFATADGALRTLPSDEMDGFFAMRFKR